MLTHRACSEPPRRQASVSDLTYMIDRNQKQPVRSGAIAAFSDFDSFASGFDKVVELLPGFDSLEFRQRYGDNSKPPNVLDYALRIFDAAGDMSEDAWYQKVVDLVSLR